VAGAWASAGTCHYGRVGAPDWPAAKAMTQQYLAGELSLLLSEVEELATHHSWAGAVALLRREAETTPPAALGAVAVRGLQLADALCWCSLADGDVAAFDKQAGVVSRLFEFGVCAGLMDEV
jgi:hypothetical protein